MSITITPNKEYQGLEISFSQVPSPEIRKQLKEHGFRWHSVKKVWFAKETVERSLFAQSLRETEFWKKPAQDLKPVQETAAKSEVLYRVEANPRCTGKHDRSFIERCERTEEGLKPGRCLYIGPWKRSLELSHQLQNGELTEKDVDEIGQAEWAARKGAELLKETASEKKPNTFASHYDSIGDAKILSSSDVDLLSQTEAYFDDIKCNFRRNYSGESVILTDLTNAGKTGKTCTSWQIYAKSYGENVPRQLMNEEGIMTCKALYNALKEGKELENVSVRVREEKGVDVFSPFIEVKPLKDLPEKWTKRNFTQALMSGQIFRGEVSYRYTDDYAMDAAYNFSEGVGLNMPAFARRTLEDWGSLTSVYSKKDAPDKDGSHVVHFSEHSNSGKTLWFDVNCDIGEGKRRAEERQAGLERFNKMMKDACIAVSSLSPDQFDAQKLYIVQQLDMNSNTGRYGVKKETVPGFVLRSRIEDDLLFDFLSAKSVDIHPARIYEVSNFFHRPNQELLSDDRVIDCGNWKCVVTGKALQELLAEQTYLPCISSEGTQFKNVESELQQFVDGHSRYFVGNASNYSESLAKLRSEYARATEKRGLDSIISGAAQRSADAQSQKPGKVLSFQR